MTGDGDKVLASRRNFEQQWSRAQTALGRETGTAPRRRGWVVPLVFAAGGLALALKLSLGRRSRR